MKMILRRLVCAENQLRSSTATTQSAILMILATLVAANGVTVVMAPSPAVAQLASTTVTILNWFCKNPLNLRVASLLLAADRPVDRPAHRAARLLVAVGIHLMPLSNLASLVVGIRVLTRTVFQLPATVTILLLTAVLRSVIVVLGHNSVTVRTAWTSRRILATAIRSRNGGPGMMEPTREVAAVLGLL